MLLLDGRDLLFEYRDLVLEGDDLFLAYALSIRVFYCRTAGR